MIFIEFVALNKQLDALNSVLDALEAKNDNIRQQMRQLLKSNQEERQKAANQDQA